MRKRISRWLVLTGMSLVATAGWCAEHVDADGEHAHPYHKHHVAAFFGNTHNHHGDDAFTVGLDYEFRFSNLFGAGAFIDLAGGEIDSAVAGGGLFIHPWKDLRLLTAIGNEHLDGHDEFLVRLGTMYDFHVGKWILTPNLNVDLLESGHQNWVAGFLIGRGF